MKKTLLAIAISLAAVPALAQTPPAAPAADAPKHKCEEPPPFPGRVGMQMEDRRKRFERALETYKSCMMAYVEERKASIKSHESAARGAIEEFNARMKKYNEEQEEARK
jgi:hypothetical protein